WRYSSHNPVKEAGQQGIGLGNEPPGGHVGGVSCGDRLEEGGVAGDVGEQERATTGSRVLRCGHWFAPPRRAGIGPLPVTARTIVSTPAVTARRPPTAAAGNPRSRGIGSVPVRQASGRWRSRPAAGQAPAAPCARPSGSGRAQRRTRG